MEAILSGSNEITASSLKTDISRDLWGQGFDAYIHPKRLVGSTRRERGRDFIESLLGYATLARLAGYKGLVVTMDEFEVELVSLTSARLEDVVDVVAELARYLTGKDAGVHAPLTVVIATTAEDGHGDRIVERLRIQTDGAFLGLEPLSPGQHNALANKIDTLYRSAYDVGGSRDTDVMRTVVDSLDNTDVEASGKIRAFIKRYVFELDSRLGPSQA